MWDADAVQPVGGVGVGVGVGGGGGVGAGVVGVGVGVVGVVGVGVGVVGVGVGVVGVVGVGVGVVGVGVVGVGVGVVGVGVGAGRRCLLLVWVVDPRFATAATALLALRHFRTVVRWADRVTWTRRQAGRAWWVIGRLGVARATAGPASPDTAANEVRRMRSRLITEDFSPRPTGCANPRSGSGPMS